MNQQYYLSWDANRQDERAERTVVHEKRPFDVAFGDVVSYRKVNDVVLGLLKFKFSFSS